MAFGLFEMMLDCLLESGRCRLLRHFWQRLHQLLFGIIEVFQSFMKQVLKGFYGHDILLVIEIVLDATAWHSAWAKYQPLRIAYPTAQMHLGSARTMH